MNNDATLRSAYVRLSRLLCKCATAFRCRELEAAPKSTKSQQLKTSMCTANSGSVPILKLATAAKVRLRNTRLFARCDLPPKAPKANNKKCTCTARVGICDRSFTYILALHLQIGGEWSKKKSDPRSIPRLVTSASATMHYSAYCSRCDLPTTAPQASMQASQNRSTSTVVFDFVTAKARI